MKSLIACALLLAPTAVMAQSGQTDTSSAEALTRALNSGPPRVVAPVRAQDQARPAVVAPRPAVVSAPARPVAAPSSVVPATRPVSAEHEDLTRALNTGRPNGRAAVGGVTSPAQSVVERPASRAVTAPAEAVQKTPVAATVQRPSAPVAARAQEPVRAVTPAPIPAPVQAPVPAPMATRPAPAPAAAPRAAADPVTPRSTAPVTTPRSEAPIATTRPIAPAVTTPALPARPVTQAPVQRSATAPVAGVLNPSAIAALPFRIDLPAGVQLALVSTAPSAKVWAVRRGPVTLAMIFSGTQSQFPIYDGEQVTVAGRTSVVVTEGQKRIAMEHLFQRSTEPLELHVWVMASSEADRGLAERIAQTLDPK